MCTGRGGKVALLTTENIRDIYTIPGNDPGEIFSIRWNKPRLLICDEPTSALDVSIQAQILNPLKDLQKEMGLTMLFVSHDLPVIRQMCDRIGVMRHGRLIEVAESEDLFERPRHDHTRTLLDLMPKLEMLSREELALGKGQADRFGPDRLS